MGVAPEPDPDDGLTWRGQRAMTDATFPFQPEHRVRLTAADDHADRTGTVVRVSGPLIIVRLDGDDAEEPLRMGELEQLTADYAIARGAWNAPERARVTEAFQRPRWPPTRATAGCSRSC
jgi:hypothetical protein